MTSGRQTRFWLAGLLVFIVLLYLLRGVLLPFVAGMAVAYLLDPICDKLESWGLSRTWATAVVTVAFLLAGIVIVVLLVPAIAGQLTELVARIPDLVQALQDRLAQFLTVLESSMSPDLLARLKESLSGNTGEIIGWVSEALGSVISGGFAVANLVSLLFITPVVAFYLLRDWDRMVAHVDGWLPRDHAEEIRGLAREADTILAGFLRGQGMVCLILGVFYAVGLTLAGLNFGLLVGLIAGLLTFIPYVGSIVGLVLSLGLALFQFDDWIRIAIVAGIFFVGQAIEGNFLTPKLVGDRVGLHPVWVIFGLLAGGALLGFVGVLLAVPLAAVIGVGVRYAGKRYLESGYYHGGGAGHRGAGASDSGPSTAERDAERG